MYLLKMLRRLNENSPGAIGVLRCVRIHHSICSSIGRRCSAYKPEEKEAFSQSSSKHQSSKANLLEVGAQNSRGDRDVALKKGPSETAIEVRLFRCCS